MSTRLLAIASLCLTRIAAQDTWSCVSSCAEESPGPTARHWHAMAYDGARRVVVLFGGYKENSLTHLDDTWEWDGTRWTEKVLGIKPVAQHSHAMAYDAARGVVVLFTGMASQNVVPGQTWEWNGTTWSWRHTMPINEERVGVGMAYDARRRRVVRFGGYGGGLWNETHAWNGSTWTRLNVPGPPARTDAQMAYDVARDRMVLFAGEASSGYHQDTWEFDGTAWQQRFPIRTPPTRARYAMAYVDTAARTIIFGSESPSGQRQTWSWDGTNWSVRPTAVAPPERTQAAMAYDAQRDVVVLFGGAYTNDIATWEYHAPIRVPGAFALYGAGCASSAGTLQLTPGVNSVPYVGSPFAIDLGPVPTGIFNVPVAILGASRTTWGSIALPFDLGILGMPGCQLLASAEVALQLPRIGNTAPLTMVIPPASSLAGLSFFVQGLVTDPFANAGGMAWSNGGEGRVGLR